MSVATIDHRAPATNIVAEIRALLRTVDRPLDGRERCMLTVLIGKASTPGDRDAVDLLDAARRAMRHRIRATGGGAAPELVALLGAVDAFLEPLDDPDRPYNPAPDFPNPDRERRDITG